MSLFSSFIFPSNSFLSWNDKSALGLAGVSIGPKLSYFFAISFRNLLYWIKVCRHQSPFQKSHTLLYNFVVNLVSIEPSLWSTETCLFFVYQFLFHSHIIFFLFTLRFLKVLVFHQNFHVFSRHVVCYFLLLTSMCICEKITSARRIISPGAFIWGERRDSPPARYIGYPIYRLFKTIYRLGDISPVSYKQVGDILLIKTRYIV